FETFLKMLTAQARYQDPLEPIDSSEYAAQLAQFSMVEQQVLSNDLLTALSDQIGAGTIGEMASWIGMEARTSQPVAFDGSPITVLPSIESDADEAVLIAYGPEGQEVGRQQIPTDNAALEWAGVGADGQPLAAGTYSFKVESRALGTAIGTSTAQSYGRITETQRLGTETVLVLESGAVVNAEAVGALREPR
ncbi:MAG: flagellar hook capping FlgD N-terminal domain-containing protein, partial [Pseudomonadota bacterium]